MAVASESKRGRGGVLDRPECKSVLQWRIGGELIRGCRIINLTALIGLSTIAVLFKSNCIKCNCKDF